MQSTSPDPALRTVTAWRTPVPVSLEPDTWRSAPGHALLTPGRSGDPAPLEPATARVLWDEQHLYLIVELTDRDVVQEDQRDQQHHYETGDVVELFLKPADADYYWEMYVTPNGRQTAFFFPGGGRRGLPSAMTVFPGLRVAATVDGTLNDWRDTDRGWTGWMSVPLEPLTAHGHAFGPGVDWRILIARYNYGRHLPDVELSSYPRMPEANWHDPANWARLHLTEAG